MLDSSAQGFTSPEGKNVTFVVGRFEVRGKEFVAAATHLKAKPGEENEEDPRLLM